MVKDHTFSISDNKSASSFEASPAFVPPPPGRPAGPQGKAGSSPGGGQTAGGGGDPLLGTKGVVAKPSDTKPPTKRTYRANQTKNLISRQSIKALASSGNPTLIKIAENMSYCRTPVFPEVFHGISQDGKIGSVGLGHCTYRHSCPHCHSHTLTQQRKMTKEAFQLWVERDPENHGVLCLTLTIPHCRYSRRVTKAILRKAWRILSRDFMKDLAKDLGWFAHVKRYEVTIGGGTEGDYHPHLHLGVFTSKPYETFYYPPEATKEEIAKVLNAKREFELTLSRTIFPYWHKAVTKALEGLHTEQPVSYSSPHGQEVGYGDYSNVYRAEGETELPHSPLLYPYIDNKGNLKGGVTLEVPSSMERWADYLSAELNYGAQKESKKSGSYTWQELLLSGEDWAHQAFCDYVLDHRGCRQFEFSKKDYDGSGRKSFYSWITGGKNVEEEEEKTSNELYITHNTPARTWHQVVNDPDEGDMVATAKDIVQQSIIDSQADNKAEVKTLDQVCPDYFVPETRSQEEIKVVLAKYGEDVNRRLAERLVGLGHLDSPFVLKYFFEGDQSKRRTAINARIRGRYGPKDSPIKSKNKIPPKPLAIPKPTSLDIAKVALSAVVMILFADLSTAKDILSKIFK